MACVPRFRESDEISSIIAIRYNHIMLDAQAGTWNPSEHRCNYEKCTPYSVLCFTEVFPERGRVTPLGRNVKVDANKEGLRKNGIVPRYRIFVYWPCHTEYSVLYRYSVSGHGY